VKTLLYGLAGLAVLLVAAVLLGPRFIDWTAYKETVAARVADATGREVRIAGRVDVNVLPRPSLTLNGLRVANAPGGDAEHLLRAGELRLELAWAPLFQGRLRLDAVELAEPRVVLESNGPEGPNWRGIDFGGLPSGLSVAAFTVTEGRVVHRDLATGRRRRLDGIDARLEAGSLRGPFAGEGRVRVRGEPVRFEGSLGRLPLDGTAPYRLTLALADGDATARVSGGLRRDNARPQAATASLAVEGATLAGVFARFGVDAPPVLRRAFSLEAEAQVDGARARAEELTLTLGEAALSGSGEVRFGEPLGLDAALSAQRLDLDRFREDGGAGLPGAWLRAAWRRLAALSGVEGRIALDVAALTHRERAVRQVALDIALPGSGVRVAEATALLPGSGRVRARGRVAMADGHPVFDGRAEISSSSLRRALRWLDLEPQAVAADRLRRLELASEVRARPGRVTLTELSGRVDNTEFEGGVAIALRDRPGVGIGLRVPALRLGGYLGPLAARPLDAVMPVFGRFDANLDLRADELVHRGRRFGEVRLKGSLNQGTLTVETGRVGRLAGGALSVEGSVAELAGAEPEVDLNVNLAIEDSERFAAFAGLDAVVPPRAGAMTLGGTITGRPRELTVDLNLDALNGLAAARGLFKPAAAPPSFQGTLKLVHDDLTALAGRMPGAPRLPPVLAGVDLSGEATATPSGLTLHTLAGRLGPMEVSGTASAEWDGTQPALEASLSTPRLPLRRLLAGTWTAGGGELRTHWLRGHASELRVTADRVPLGAGLAVTGARLNARAREGTLTLTQFEGGLAGGRVGLSGELRGGGTPAVTGRARADGVRIGTVLSRVGAGKPVTGPVSLEGEVRSEGRTADALLRTLSGTGSLTGELTLAPEAAAAIDARTAGRSGVLDAFAGRAAGVSGTFDLDRGVATTGDTTLSGEGARARLQGRADLPAWEAEATIAVGRADAEPALTARLSGPLDAPAMTLDAVEPAAPALDLPVGEEDDPAGGDPLPPAETAAPDPPAPTEPAIGRVAPGRPAPESPAIGRMSPPTPPAPESPAIGRVPAPAPDKPAISSGDEVEPGEPAGETDGGEGAADSIIEGVIEEYGE